MIELVILGEPQRKQRPRFNRNTGVAYTPQDTLNYENLIKHEYMAKYGKMAFDDNDCIEATIVAYFKMPKTDFGKNGLSKSGRERVIEGLGATLGLTLTISPKCVWTLLMVSLTQTIGKYHRWLCLKNGLKSLEL
jgi:hypothetical protein